MSDLLAKNETGAAAKPTEQSPVPPQVNSGSAIHEQPDGNSRKQERCPKLSKAPLWIEAACAILLVFITGYYAYFARQQATAAIKAAGAAAANADAAKQQAETAKGTLDEIKKGANDTHDLAVAAKDQAVASKQLARNTVIALEFTKQSFQNDQRAWVGLGEYKVMEFNAKEPFKLAIHLVNSGKTPAISTEKAINYGLSLTWPTGPPQNPPYKFEPSASIPPQGKYVVIISDSAVTPLYGDILSRKRFLYFYGVFRYHDVYRKDLMHSTEFCLIFNPDIAEMSFCLTGNQMN